LFRGFAAAKNRDGIADYVAFWISPAGVCSPAYKTDYTELTRGDRLITFFRIMAERGE